MSAIEIPRTATLVAATVSAGLLAGLFHTFSVAVMPGLRRGEDHTFVDAMRQINLAILNPWFLLTFAGTPLLIILTGLLHLGAGRDTLAWIVAGFAMAVATLAITAGVNVPLNNALGAAETRQAADPARARSAFENRWIRWNHVRTGTSTAAFLCLVLALATSR